MDFITSRHISVTEWLYTIFVSWVTFISMSYIFKTCIAYFIFMWRKNYITFCVICLEWFGKRYICMLFNGVRLYTMMPNILCFKNIILVSFDPLNFCSFYFSSFHFNKWHIFISMLFLVIFTIKKPSSANWLVLGTEEYKADYLCSGNTISIAWSWTLSYIDDLYFNEEFYLKVTHGVYFALNFNSFNIFNFLL